MPQVERKLSAEVTVYSPLVSPVHYSFANEILIMAVFGLIGYVLRKLKFDVAPLLLAVVLGDRIEVSLRRALIITNGDYWALFQGHAARVIVIAALVLVILQSIAWALGFRKKMMTGESDEVPR